MLDPGWYNYGVLLIKSFADIRKADLLLIEKAKCLSMKQLLRIVRVLCFICLISETVQSQTLYSDDESRGIIVYSGYSNLEGPASSVTAGVGYSVKRELDLSFEYSVVNHGIDGSGYWISEPEKTALYTGAITLYPLRRLDGRQLMGQITVGTGWMVDSYNDDGPIVSLSAALSGKSNLADDVDMFPRFTLSYVPIVGDQLVRAISLGIDLSLSVEVSSEFSLLFSPILSVDVKELNMTSGVVIGVIL